MKVVQWYQRKCLEPAGPADVHRISRDVQGLLRLFLRLLGSPECGRAWKSYLASFVSFSQMPAASSLGIYLHFPCAFSLALWSPWFYWQRPQLIILCVRREVRGGCFPTADFFGLKIPRVSEMLRWRWGDGGGSSHSAAPKALSFEQHLLCEGQAHPGRISLVARRGVSDAVAQFSDQTLVP